MNKNFNMSFDPTLRQQFAEVVADYGLTVPQAFKLFANQVVKTQSIPLSFDWRSNDSELTDKALAALAQNEKDRAEGKFARYADFDEMMADLAP